MWRWEFCTLSTFCTIFLIWLDILNCCMCLQHWRPWWIFIKVSRWRDSGTTICKTYSSMYYRKWDSVLPVGMYVDRWFVFCWPTFSTILSKWKTNRVCLLRNLILLYSMTTSRESNYHWGYIRFLVKKRCCLPQEEHVVLRTECLLRTVLCLVYGVWIYFGAVWSRAQGKVRCPSVEYPTEALMAFQSQSVSLAGNWETSHMPR